jgi:SAM-dependent methyltransferase
VFNLAFHPEEMKYGREYENSLHFSPRFQEYALELAGRLIERYELRDKVIVEIGSGKGEFLSLLCHLGGNRGFGFDPSYDHSRAGHTNGEKIIFITDFFSSAYSDIKADIICCRHVLEHIQSPSRLLTDIHQMITAGRHRTVVFFEVPNAKFTFRDMGIWDLIYEHCSYFSAVSLKYLFASCRFGVYDCSEVFDGQFLSVEAVAKNCLPNFRTRLSGNTEETHACISTFAHRYEKAVKKWRHRLADTLGGDGKITIWGAGSKGVTFLNVLKTNNQIKYAVDINTYKQGKYIPGTGQEVIPPKRLRQYRPDAVIVMNPIYRREIRQNLERLGLKTALLSV